MSESCSFYSAVYQAGVAAEAEWLRLGAPSKFKSIDRLTSRLPRPFSSLCELGCGTGAILQECIRAGIAKKYIGVDGSADALEWLRPEGPENLTLVHHDLETGPPDISADLVVLSHVLEHLRNPEVLLTGLLGKCCYILAEVPLENQIVPRSRAWFRSAIWRTPRTDNVSGHVQFYSKGSFQGLMSHCGWHVVAERCYLPFRKEAIAFAARRNGSSRFRSYAPLLLSKLLRNWLGSRCLGAHYAVLATNTGDQWEQISRERTGGFEHK